MIAAALWFLATIDAAYIGYREAAGRNALINKREYYCRAMLRGAFWGQIAIFAVVVLIGITFLLSSEPDVLLADLNRVGARMLRVYIPFALITFSAFILRSLPSVDIKSITSTVIFGPFTLLRPLVAVAGIVYGFSAATKPEILFLGFSVLTLMLGLEWFIGHLRKRKFIT